MKVFRRKSFSTSLNPRSRNLKFMRASVEAAEASSGAPLGPLLGQVQVPLLEFCNSFNDKTGEVYNDPVDLRLSLFKAGSNYSYQVSYPTISFFFYQNYLKYELDLEDSIYEFYNILCTDLWFIALMLSTIRGYSLKKSAKILFGYINSSSINIYLDL